MNSPVSTNNSSQKRGRTFLVAALLLIAAFILNGFIQSLAKDETDLAGGIIGNGLLLLMLVLAFRGGQLSMKLTKGCAMLFACVVAVLILVVSITLIRGNPLPAAPTLENTVLFVATAIGVAFCIWALFISKDVKSFVAYQREAAYQRKLDIIKRK